MYKQCKMKRPSLAILVTGIFVAYVGHTAWTMYHLFYPKTCTLKPTCIKPYLSRNPQLHLLVYTSSKLKVSDSSSLKLVLKYDNFSVDVPSELQLDVEVPLKTKQNGTLYVHVFLLPRYEEPFRSRYVSHQQSHLTSYLIPEAETFSLINDGSTKQSDSKPRHQATPVSHWRSHLKINVVKDFIAFDRTSFPPELIRFAKLSPEGDYLPLLFIDDVSSRIRDFQRINETAQTLPLTVIYSPISIGHLRLWVQIEESLKLMESLGFKEKDTDEVKGIFADTNFFFLMLTFVVSVLHLLFDFLAFKNDISFWRSRDSMVGLSLRTVIWRCVSQTVVFLYLLDEETSKLVLYPAGIATIIEFWKVKKALKLRVQWVGYLPRFYLERSSKSEKQTEAYDSEAMRYLSYILYPLCLGGAVYSLFYVPHKSWYSWCVKCLVNFVYAFGFLFMLPQLFLNYKLKSVAHLPWRAFMYKAFNTFIDDIFAFIITMPTAHRVACFRDDAVFLVYLYQRWLYPVDKTRVNEYGRSYEHEIDSNDVSTKPKSE